MRRQILAGAVAAATLGVAGPAQAFDQTATVSATPSVFKAGSGMTLKVSTAVDSADPSETLPGTVGGSILFPAGFTLNKTKFATCAAAVVQEDDTQCKSESKVGSGTALGAVPALALEESLTIKLYNGSGSSINMLILGTAPVPIRANISAKVTKMSGAYSYKFTFALPESLIHPVEGATSVIKKLDVKVAGKKRASGKTVSFITANGRCPSSRKLGYQSTFDYTDGQKKSVKGSQSCS